MRCSSGSAVGVKRKTHESRRTLLWKDAVVQYRIGGGALTQAYADRQVGDHTGVISTLLDGSCLLEDETIGGDAYLSGKTSL